MKDSSNGKRPVAARWRKNDKPGRAWTHGEIKDAPLGDGYEVDWLCSETNNAPILSRNQPTGLNLAGN